MKADEHGRRYLEVEAGTAGLGPTYRLALATRDSEGQLMPAGDDVPADALILLPTLSIGLYDDRDDDIGVPWALPSVFRGRFHLSPSTGIRSRRTEAGALREKRPRHWTAANGPTTV